MNHISELYLTESQKKAQARNKERGTVGDASDAVRADGAKFDPHLSNRWVGENGAASSLESAKQQWFFKNLGFSFDIPTPTPISATSVKDLIQEFENFESFKQQFLDSRGNIIELLMKRNVEKDGAFIDQITFTGGLQSLNNHIGNTVETVAMISVVISGLLHEIFGFGITSQTATRSNFFYEHVFLCEGSEGNLYAKVHFGGQNNTFCVEIKGLGISVAPDDWHKRLYNIMSASWFVRPKITRIDIAMDFFNGEYTPEQAREDRLAGLYNTGNKIMPKAQCMGTEWEDDTGKDKSGKTYAIGTRNSPRYARIYNKAAEQKVKGFWTRFEIEFGRSAIIPLDALANPTAYFCGAFPACSKFTQHEAKQVETKKLKLASTIERQLEIFKKQAGRALNFFIEWFQDLPAEQLIQKIKADHNLLPERLHPAAWSSADSVNVPFHDMTEMQVNQTLLCGF